MELPYRFICIEGNIGAGKTTLCRKLADLYHAELILEEFTDNPFLENFYASPERYALQVELFFLSERYKQLNSFPINGNLLNTPFISDYIFIKSLLFASHNLSGDELGLFRRLFDIVAPTLPQPEIIFYIHRKPIELLDLIQKRNRNFELGIQQDYLKGIEESYFQYFNKITRIPVVIIDSKGLDFENNPEDFEYIIDIITQPHSKKVTYLTKEDHPLFG
ncbi:MAG: deoxynucleoside kinase [Saprospirales bacterium]|nr:MAG: deoxynucleoside kinase [Saprospirales bacterium]